MDRHEEEMRMSESDQKEGRQDERAERRRGREEKADEDDLDWRIHPRSRFIMFSQVRVQDSGCPGVRLFPQWG